MQIVGKPAHLVRIGDIVVELDYVWCVLETADSWDGGIMLSIFDLCEGSRENHFYAAFDIIDVLA